MLVEVDTNFLIKNNLTSKEFLFCYLIYKKTHYQLSKYLKFDPVDLAFMKELVKKEWISGYNLNSITDIKVTKKFSDLFSIKDYFQELLDTYPKDVTRQDGTRVYLRTAQKECKKRYIRIIKNSRLKHEQIINALNTEIKLKSKDNKMMWFKTLPNWLKAEEWQQYEGILEDSPEVNNNNTYGSTII